MITFQKIRFKNLLSYGDKFTQLDFQESNTTLIVGTNGSGKSALLDALTLVVFNKPFRKITKPMIVSNVNERECVIELLFETNGKQYKIIRGLKPTKFEIYEKEFTGTPEFDGWNSKYMLDQTIIGEQQKFLENNIIKMNYLSFIQVVVLGKAKYVSFFALDNAKRRVMVEEMLSSTIFGQMNKLLKTRLLIISNKLVDVNFKIDKLSSKIELQKNHISELNKSNDIVVDDIEREVIVINSQLAELFIRRDDLNERHNKLKEQSDRISNCNSELKKINSIKDKLESKASYFVKDIDFFKDNDSCPKCSQGLSDETKHLSITSLNTQIDSQNSKIVKVDSKISQLQDVVAEYSSLVLKTNAIWSENNSVSTTISNLGIQKDQATEKIQKLKTTIDTKKASIDLMAFSDSYNTLLTEKSELLNDESVSLNLQKVLSDDGAKQLLIRKYIPVFNKYINFYLVKMGLNISFTLDENFNEKILSRYRDKSSYYSFSEGEKLRIDLAMLLTWRTVSQLRNSVNTNLLILDEIFDSSLDMEGVDGFVDSLNTFSDMNVIVVSHTPDKINKWANRILKAEKLGNFSRLENHHTEA